MGWSPRKRTVWAAWAALLLVDRGASAQPLRTWGGELPPTSPGASSSSPSAPPTPPTAPLPPPPTTIGTPVEDGGAQALSSTPPPTEESPSVALIRAPGKVGLRYALEGVEVRGNVTTLARVILRYVPFHAGDTLDVDDKELELTRFRLLGTGFFQNVRLSLRRGSRRGYAVLVVNVVERNTVVVNDLWLGLSADANASTGSARPLTAYGGVDVSETNLAGSGITLGGAVALAENQLALRARFADPQFLSSNWTVEAQVLYSKALDFFGNRDVLVSPPQGVAQDYALVPYRRFGGLVGAGHDLGVSTVLYVDYRIEKIDAVVPVAASHHRGLDIEPIDFFIHDGTSVLSTVRTTLLHDTRDEPILPTKGLYLLLNGDVSLTPLGSDYPYVKLTTRLAGWTALPWGHVLRLEGFVGAVFGDAPMFEKFYVGDFSDLLPDRVLELNVDRRAAPNFFGTDIAEIRYGSYAAKVDVEYRVPVYRGRRSIYGVDFFASTGVYGVANQLDLTSPARGYTGFSTAPIDLTFNVGLKIDTSAGGFTFGISNFLGFIPVRGSTQ